MSWYGRRLTTFRSHGKEARKVAERDIFSSSALTPSINGIRMRKSIPASAIIRRLERIRSFGTPVKRRWLPESICFKSTRKRSVRSITLRTVSGEANKVVSTARWIPNAPQRSSRATKSDGRDNGSPPQKVTPPSERSIKTVSFSISRMTSSIEYSRPDISIAKVGQTSAHLPHVRHRDRFVTIPASVKVNAPVGHTSTQAPQPMHFFLVYSFSARGEMPSGLWHHTQASGHPFMKIVIRMPGPSFMAYRLISNNSMAQKVSCSVRAITSACKSAFISLK